MHAYLSFINHKPGRNAPNSIDYYSSKNGSSDENEIDTFRSQGKMRLKINACSEVTGEESTSTAITTITAGVS
jgi:hypothetical protein